MISSTKQISNVFIKSNFSPYVTLILSMFLKTGGKKDSTHHKESNRADSEFNIKMNIY